MSQSALRGYDGEVRIYTGETLRLRLKMGRRLVAFKNPDGSYEGCLDDAINELNSRGGVQLWEIHNDPHTHKKNILECSGLMTGKGEKKDILDYFKIGIKTLCKIKTL